MTLQHRPKTAQEQHWQEVIDRQRKSGKNVKSFCQDEKLKRWQFFWWQHELVKRGLLTGTNRCRKRSRPRFAPVVIATGLDAGVELCLPQGRRVRVGRGFDAETLARVLSVVEGRSC
jgi:hypothetical protein